MWKLGEKLEGSKRMGKRCNSVSGKSSGIKENAKKMGEGEERKGKNTVKLTKSTWALYKNY